MFLKSWADTETQRVPGIEAFRRFLSQECLIFYVFFRIISKVCICFFLSKLSAQRPKMVSPWTQSCLEEDLSRSDVCRGHLPQKCLKCFIFFNSISTHSLHTQHNTQERYTKFRLGGGRDSGESKPPTPKLRFFLGFGIFILEVWENLKMLAIFRKFYLKNRDFWADVPP